MLDEIGDVIAFLLDGGMSSPDTMRRQRQARLTVAVLALAVNLGLAWWIGDSALRGWAIVVVAGMTFAAGWALLFSVVDAAKERPPLPWLSVAAAAAGIAAIVIFPLLVFA